MTKAKFGVLILSVFLLAVSAILFFFFSRGRHVEYSRNKWTRLMDNCAYVLEKVQYTPDYGIPEGPMINCNGIGIFPSTISGGFGFGAQYGEGVIVVRDKNYNRWSNPAVFTIAGGSFGFQMGGQSTDIILLFMDRRSVDIMLRGKVKLGADASVAAGPVGRSASVSTDTQLKGAILSYSVSRGFFAGAKLEGSVITQNWLANKELYGKNISAEEILAQKNAPRLPATQRLVRVLNCYNPINYLVRKAFGKKCP